MIDLPVWRLYALRAGYLLFVLGLGPVIWPGLIHHEKPWALPVTVVRSMLGAMSLVAILGLRYPLKMVPLLFFELTWKAIWLIVIALPLWSAHQLDAAGVEIAEECYVAVIFVIVIPWRYVFATYVMAPGDRWR